MSIIPLSLQRAGVDTMSTVSAIAGTVTAATSIASSLAEAGAAHAHDYKANTISELALTSAERTMLRLSERAMHIAQHKEDVAKRLEASPSLKAEYELALAAFSKIDGVVARIHAAE